MAAGITQTARDLSIFVRHDAPGLAGLDLAVDGIRCAGCMSTIEKGLASERGVVSARVNLASKRVTVQWREGEGSPEAVIDRLRALGFKAHPFAPEAVESDEAREEKRLLRCLGVAAFSAMNIMLLSVSVWSGNASDITPETRDFFHWLSALIALPTAAYSGRPFFDSAIRALKARAVNMDVPITLGILLALGMSVVETLNHAEHAYFDSAVMLIFFLLIGRWMDQSMRRKTRAFAGNLAALKGETAVKFISATELCEVPVGAIQPGDLLLVRPGERIAADGLIHSGSSQVDQSMITGETAYADIREGTRVYAGALNIGGTIQLRVIKAGDGTLIDEVNRLLHAATAHRSRYVALADRAARAYAPMVHLTAALTFTGWMLAGQSWQFSLVTAITVLIITCPCALALAIPAVQIVASGALFRRSVLLNAGDALERFAEVDTVVFDKTGTLTLPEPSLANMAELSPQVLALAGRLALSSKHPLACAVAQASGASEPINSREEPGRGVVAMHDGTEIRLGSLDWCDAHGHGANTAARHPDASLMAFRQGETVHILALHQAIRPDAARVIADMRTLGLRVMIMSGDRASAVTKVAAALGIDEAFAALDPSDKIARIEALRAQGRKVLMVGDGLNDAPALAAAHVSLSPVTAAHLAQASADAVFLGDSLAPVGACLSIGRRARAVMSQNLWMAVGYNFIAVPIAIAGYATPLVAALAMSGSSMIVTLNALRAGRAPGLTEPQAGHSKATDEQPATKEAAA
jgi:P-type Cu2+ transporter